MTRSIIATAAVVLAATLGACATTNANKDDGTTKKATAADDKASTSDGASGTDDGATGTDKRTADIPVSDTGDPAAGSSKEDTLGACGPRASYQLVADWVCPDGSKPLGGDMRRGAASRRGNVGANSSGHIIDLYEIPCPSGAVQVFVDMYQCGK